MPRGRRSSRPTIKDDDSEDEVNNHNPTPLPTLSGNDVDDDDDDTVDDRKNGVGNGVSQVTFSFQMPEMSQSILPVRESERNNLMKMIPEAREKVLTDLSRLILFKALAGEPIDRLKCCKEAGISTQDRISSAAFDEVKKRLMDVFGFEIRRYPKYMEKIKNISSKYKDRYFVINGSHIDGDDQEGTHSKMIHSVHTDCAIEKGLLMIILALAYCKGDPRPDGSRWICDMDLYRLLNAIDENIPNEPLRDNTKSSARGKRASSSPSSSQNNKRKRSSLGEGAMGVGLTPSVDDAINHFVHMDYLLREKITEEAKETSQSLSQMQVDEGGFLYSMGPRAALEIGKRQIIYFCAEILDEEPDPTMLMEVQQMEQDEEEQEETQQASAPVH